MPHMITSFVLENCTRRTHFSHGENSFLLLYLSMSFICLNNWKYRVAIVELKKKNPNFLNYYPSFQIIHKYFVKF